MTLYYTIEPTVSAVFAKHYGEVSTYEMSSFFQKILRDPELVGGMNFYRDTRGAIFSPEWDFQFFSIHKNSETHRALVKLGKCKLAWVSDTGTPYVIAHQALLSSRMLRTDLLDRQLFRTSEVAKNWLGIPKEFEISLPDGS